MLFTAILALGAFIWLTVMVAQRFGIVLALGIPFVMLIIASWLGY